MDMHRAFNDILTFTEEHLDENISRIERSNYNQREELNLIKTQIKEIILTLAEKFSIGLDSQPTLYEESLSSKVKTYIKAYSKQSIPEEKQAMLPSVSPAKTSQKSEEVDNSRKLKENPEVVPESANVKKFEEASRALTQTSSPIEILKEKKSSDHQIAKLKKAKSDHPKSPFLSTSSSYFPKRFITDKVPIKSPQSIATITTNTISSIKDSSLVINESHLEDESLINSLKPEDIAIKPEPKLSPEKKDHTPAPQPSNSSTSKGGQTNANESFSNKQGEKIGHSRNNSKSKASYYISPPATEKKMTKLISSVKKQEVETTKKSGLSVKEHQKKVTVDSSAVKKPLEASSTRKSSANEPSMDTHKIEKNLSAKFEEKAYHSPNKTAGSHAQDINTAKKNAKTISSDHMASLLRPQEPRQPRSMTENEYKFEKQKVNYSMSEEKKSNTTERNSSPPSKIKSYYYFFDEKK